MHGCNGIGRGAGAGICQTGGSPCPFFSIRIMTNHGTNTCGRILGSWAISIEMKSPGPQACMLALQVVACQQLTGRQLADSIMQAGVISGSLCSAEHSHQIWLTETRLLVLWKLPHEAVELHLVLRQRAAAFPTSTGPPVSTPAALTQARNTRDLKLIPFVTDEQRDHYEPARHEYFNPHGSRVEVLNPAESLHGQFASRVSCKFQMQFVETQPVAWTYEARHDTSFNVTRQHGSSVCIQSASSTRVLYVR